MSKKWKIIIGLSLGVIFLLVALKYVFFSGEKSTIQP